MGVQGTRPGRPLDAPQDRIFREGYDAGLRDAELRHRNGSGDMLAEPTDKAYNGRPDGSIPMHLGAYREETLDERLTRLFTYHPPHPNQLTAYDSIRTAARHFAEILLKNTPPSKDQEAALNKLRVVVMLANASIALDGRS